MPSFKTFFTKALDVTLSLAEKKNCMNIKLCFAFENLLGLFFSIIINQFSGYFCYTTYRSAAASLSVESETFASALEIYFYSSQFTIITFEFSLERITISLLLFKIGFSEIRIEISIIHVLVGNCGWTFFISIWIKYNLKTYKL